MEIGLGWLRWTPDAFWSATLGELLAAQAGFVESKTGKNPRAERARLDMLYAEAKAAEGAPVIEEP